MEMKKLPTEWKRVQLKEITHNIQYGYTESSSKERIGPKFLRITDIQDNNVEWENVPFCKIDNETKTKYILEEGDLLFARTGATVGKSFLIKGKIPESVFASYLIRVRFKKEINEKLLAYFFNSPYYWNQITDGQVGTGQPNVNGTKLGQLNIPLPPTDVQDSIVYKIEELFSELDKGIEYLRLAQQQLKTYRQAVLKWAFEGRLTNEKVNEGELPEGWKLTKLGEVSILITKGASPKWQGINYVKDSSQVLFVTSENVRENYIDISSPKYLEASFNEKQKKSILKKGDVLLNIVGASIGRAAIYDLDLNANINQAVSIIRLSDKIMSKYVSFYLNSNKALSYYNLNKVDVARANLSLADVGNIELALPPKEDQVRIIQEIERRHSIAEKIEERITYSMHMAEALRQSILKKAFGGQLI